MDQKQVLQIDRSSEIVITFVLTYDILTIVPLNQVAFFENKTLLKPETPDRSAKNCLL